MKDKLMIGVIAGTVGDIIKNILTFIYEKLNLHPTFWDYGYYLIFQKSIDKLDSRIIPSIIVELFFGIGLATMYSYLAHFMETKHILLRGIMFGGLIWFSLRGAITLSHIKELVTFDLTIIFLNWAATLIFGLTVALVIRYLEKE